VLVAALSPVWSLDPQRSLRGAVLLEAGTAFGLWLALRFELAELLRLLCGSLALMVAGSVLVIALWPEQGVMWAEHPGAWKGLYLHKNLLARYLSLAVLACGLLACADPRARAWATATAALALAMLLPARSVGGAATLALAAGATALAAGLARIRPQLRRRAALAAGASFGLTAALAAAWLPELLTLVGRDVTLTRRTEIWALLLPPLREHLFLGHGVDAFWRVSPAYRTMVETLGFDPTHAHNGLVDLALELGLAGLLALLVPFALAARRALRLALDRPGALACWPVAFLAWWLASNLPESALLEGRRLGWVVFVALAATLAGGQRQGPA
jgi:O-antigen ligase